MKKRLGLFLLAIPFMMGCTKKESNEILIGQFNSLTGEIASFGTSTDEGIRMAIDEVNAKGGVKGKKIKLVTVDTGSKPEGAASAATRLITQDKVVALIGEVASSLSKAAAPIAQKNQIPMVSTASTNPAVTGFGDYIFRVCFIDPFQGLVMAKFATETLKAKNAAILRDVKQDYSVGLADVFKTEFVKMGGKIVDDQSYQSKDVDFKAQLNQIKSKNPDVLFVPGYYNEVGLIAKQAAEVGLKIKLLGGDGWDSEKLSEIGKEAVNGHYFSNHYSSDSTEPVVQEFLKKYKQVYNGKTPDALAALGYDAAKIVIAALESASEISPKAIKEQLAKTKDFPGVTGKITINDERNAVKSAVVVQVDGVNRKYVTTVNP